MFAYLLNAATFILCILPFAIDMSDSMPSTSLCEPNSDDGNNTPPRHKVRGKGKGGDGVKYCTMSPRTRKGQFLGHPLSVRTNDVDIEVVWCDACGCPLEPHDEEHGPRSFALCPCPNAHCPHTIHTLLLPTNTNPAHTLHCLFRATKGTWTNGGGQHNRCGNSAT